jgi:hypothetical protein
MISLRLDKNLENELNAFSTSQNCTKSKIVKNALIYYFDMLKSKNEQKTPYELGSAFFGKYSSKSGDLSTTYKQKIKEKIYEKNHH